MPQPPPCLIAMTPSIFGKSRSVVEALRNVLADGRRAVDGRNDRDIVPRSRFAGRALIALKGAAQNGCWRRRSGGGAGVVADEFAVDQIVRVDPLARLDRCCRLADNLAVFSHVIALVYRPHGDLV